MKFAKRFRRGASAGERAWTSRVPDGYRVYAIGDIHGRADLLAHLHEMIAADSAARGDANIIIVYLGDYVDRGPDSRRVLELAAGDHGAGFRTIALGGNHEAMMRDFMADPLRHHGWLANGGDATLRSFRIAVPSEFGPAEKLTEAAHLLSHAMRREETEFLAGLRLSYRLGDYFFAHAGVRPHVDLDVQVSEDLLWIRRPFLESDADFGAVVVHGHSVRPEVEIRCNRIGIDTGAYATGCLTALGLEGADYWLLQTLGCG